MYTLAGYVFGNKGEHAYRRASLAYPVVSVSLVVGETAHQSATAVITRR